VYNAAGSGVMTEVNQLALKVVGNQQKGAWTTSLHKQGLGPLDVKRYGQRGLV